MQYRTLLPGTFVNEITPGRVHVGSNPEHSIVFSGLAEDEVTWLRGLVPIAGASRSKQSRSSKPELPERQIEVLRLLDSVGLLSEPTIPLQLLRMRVVGLDRVGITLILLLARAGVRHIEVRGKGDVDAEVEHLFPVRLKGLTRVKALKELLSSNFSVSSSKLVRPDLVFVCSNRVWDHGVLGTLLSEDIVHIPVVSDDRSVSVGPLIAPGLTPCALCVEMYVSDQNPAWPAQSLQLRLAPPIIVSDHLACTAAGLAVTMSEAAAKGVPLRSRQHLSTSDSLMYQATSTGIQEIVWKPHPRCTCTARFTLGSDPEEALTSQPALAS